MRSLLQHWLEVRQWLAREFVIRHNSVFLNPKNFVSFDANSFSKYFKSAFKEVTGRDGNLQTLRRIFSSGVCASLCSNFHKKPSDFMDHNPGDENMEFLSTAMMTSKSSLKRVYTRVHHQKRSFDQVLIPEHCEKEVKLTPSSYCILLLVTDKSC